MEYVLLGSSISRILLSFIYVISSLVYPVIHIHAHEYDTGTQIEVCVHPPEYLHTAEHKEVGADQHHGHKHFKARWDVIKLNTSRELPSPSVFLPFIPDDLQPVTRIASYLIDPAKQKWSFCFLSVLSNKAPPIIS